MRVTIAGDFKEPIMFTTDKATAVMIDTQDGSPAVIYKFVANKNAYIRLTRGEDKAFDTIYKQLNLNTNKV